MHKNINTLIASALLLGLFSSLFAFPNAEAALVTPSNSSDAIVNTISVSTTSYSNSAPQVAPPAPAPQVAEASQPPPVNNEYVLQRAARN